MVLTKETSLFMKDSIADDIGEAVASAVSVYMRKNASQTAPSKPTASTTIGTSPTTDGAWEYVMPYPKKNFKFYTCEQYTKVDGTKEYSDVRELSSETYISKWVHDADATYIDGGSLYTNSVTADKIQAGAITIGKLSNDALYNVIYSVSTEHAVSEYPYIKLCTIQTVRAYQNKDVVFSISSRLSRMDTEINWAFNNSSSATASVVSHAYKTGSAPVFYVSEGNGKYGIYVSKADKYENLQVHDLYNPYPNGITIEWIGTEVASLPSGYVAFTELAGSRPAEEIDEAATKATTYITAIDEEGIKVHAAKNPNSNYAKINADGMEVYRGGNAVAKFGQTIELSDGTKTLYEVKPLSGASKLTRIYNITLTDTVDGMMDTVYLGRTISSWPSNAITVNYKIFNSDTLAFTTGSKSYKPSRITSGQIIAETSFKYSLSAILDTVTSSIELSFSNGTTLADTESVIIESVEISFNTAQTVIESTLGAYPDTSQSAVFRIGSGTSDTQKSNALSVDWGGNAFLNGDIYANCNNDSTGGVSLGTVRYIPSAYNIETSNFYMDIGVYQIGMIVLLDIECWRNSSINAGVNIFNLDISKTEIPLPEGNYVSGMMYYNNRPLGIRILEGESEGEAGIRFRVRNCSASAVTVSSNDDGARGNLMYISSGQTCADYYYEHLNEG